jgi:hypothetical protein
LVPHHEVALFEKGQAVGKGVEEHVETLSKLLRPRLREINKVHRALPLIIKRLHILK